ncbi:hypothetical protein B0H10DRAFT_1948035 [Mycena sp. CBHHK59/15]|nr:hypothetical protein B0H10DRAFT_1948035 [Mycena sp. CBHHK59/15]
MPESCESQASFEIVDVAVTALIKEGVSLRIKNIEIDATETEQKRFKDHPARSGLPYAIDSKFTVKRGISKAQSHLYPEMWHTPGKKMSEHLLTELLLKDISYTHRALILDLGPLFLMPRHPAKFEGQYSPSSRSSSTDPFGQGSRGHRYTR